MDLSYMSVVRLRAAYLLIVGLSVFLATNKAVQAQTLTSKLKQEALSALLDDALEKGRPVQGALIFNRKSIECGRCHAGQNDQPLGPTLAGATARDQKLKLIESILEPDKVIKEGFESYVVTTLDGRVLTGRLIERNDETIVLRDGSTAGTIVTLQTEDVEELQLSPRSLMPANLPDQLKSRQEFLDLVAYVVQQASRDLSVVESTTDSITESATLSLALQGHVVFDRYRCQACHGELSSDSPSKGALAPNLTEVHNRLQPDFIADYIVDPETIHPGTKMPNLFGPMDEEQKALSAKALNAYLESLRSEPEFKIDLERISKGRGEELYHSVGCIACHGPWSEKEADGPNDSFSALGPIAEKYTLAGLTQLLESPHTIRPSGRMPSLQLTHWEAQDIASFLLDVDLEKPFKINQPTTEADGEIIKLGKSLFQQLSCNRCHESSSQDQALLPIQDRSAGCLSDQKGPWPKYTFTSDERQALDAAMKELNDPLTREQHLQVQLTSLNCLACHQRDELGGVSREIDSYFQTTDQNLGQQGRLPPTLTGVGAKLHAGWMRDVLVNQKSIRPYMLTRMPQFAPHKVESIIDDFQSLDQLPTTESPRVPDEKALREAGLQLVGNQGMNCVACHTYRFETSETMPAVDLTEMGERLKKDWFVQYMQSPQSFSPNTVMPTFWPEGHSTRADILEGNTELQIEAIWNYLLEGRNARAPRGVIREPIELLATNDEAVMLRRAYPGIGKRGIGVGYPEEVNIAFDAEQLRLGMIWKGKFAEMSGVWRGQGSGTVQPRGQDRLEFAKGPELDSSQQSWIVDEGRPPDHHFEGYELDDTRRPTFFYRYQDVQVADFLSAGSVSLSEKEAASIRNQEPKTIVRKLSFASRDKHHDLRFRVASGDKIESLGQNKWAIDGRLIVEIEGSESAKVVNESGSKELLIPLSLEASTKTNLTLKYTW